MVMTGVQMVQQVQDEEGGSISTACRKPCYVGSPEAWPAWLCTSHVTEVSLGPVGSGWAYRVDDSLAHC